jgi:hypothetical protein
MYASIKVGLNGEEEVQMASAETPQELDHFYQYGDVYEALEACDQLEVVLGRLKRQHLLPLAECQESRDELAHIRERLEGRIDNSAFTPKGPHLP